MSLSQLQIIEKELETLTRNRTVKLANQTVRALQKATPKDSGWASYNWRPKTRGATVALAPKPLDLASIPGAKAEQLAALAELKQYRLTEGPISVVNGVPYIGLLNAGSSAKAPAGFVEQVISDVTRKVLDL